MSTQQADWLARQFEDQRGRLRAVAYRLLGSSHEADDAVQEAWLRLNRSDADTIENLAAWLTSVVSRICLDMLRSRASRREQPLEAPEPVSVPAPDADPEREAAMAESVGFALLVVLERLQPAERIAFVLHDMFAVSFGDVAAILGRSEPAVRQLASRARRRARGPLDISNEDLSAQRHVVEAFLAALRAGDFEGLLAVLDPDVAVRIEGGVAGGVREVRGARSWAEGAQNFARLARFIQPALLDGSVGLIYAPRGRLVRALRFTVRDGKIVAGEVIADPGRLRRLVLAPLPE